MKVAHSLAPVADRVTFIMCLLKIRRIGREPCPVWGGKVAGYRDERVISTLYHARPKTPLIVDYPNGMVL